MLFARYTVVRERRAYTPQYSNVAFMGLVSSAFETKIATGLPGGAAGTGHEIADVL